LADGCAPARVISMAKFLSTFSPHHSKAGGRSRLDGRSAIARAKTVPGVFLSYPNRRQQPAAVSALIDALRLENPCK
jgi:hypothetical protein